MRSFKSFLPQSLAFVSQQEANVRPTDQPVTPTTQSVQATTSAKPAGTVTFDNLGKTYHSSAGPVHALQDISLAIPAGSIYGIIGRSGAGKSSLLRTINRLEQPTSGRVLVDEIDISTLDENALVTLRRRIGMIFQHFNLLSAKTVWENVALPLKVAGVEKNEIRRRVGELLELVGLQTKHDTYPGRLSGGQKQRIGIARALVHHPEILLCDEATSALDPETTQAILQLLRDINRRLGLTVVLITHEMGVIREICDQVLVLEKGRIAESGAVWQVFGNPQHAATRALLRTLEHDLPEELTQQLLPEPPAYGRFERVIEIRFTGHADIEPNLAHLSAALGASTRLLHGGVDRIQGHAHGRLLLVTGGVGPSADALISQHLCHQAKVLGYVPHPH